MGQQIVFSDKIWDEGEHIHLLFKNTEIGWLLGSNDTTAIMALPDGVLPLPFLSGYVSHAPQWLWCVAADPLGAKDDDEIRSYNVSGVPVSDCHLCEACQGSGKYVGFFVVEDCDHCDGVGLLPPGHVVYQEILQVGD